MSNITLVDEYANFVPLNYLKTYYTELDDENSFLMKFFNKVYSEIKNKDKLIEIGGGPTIYQLISASCSVDKIYFSDYLDSNQREVKKWVDNDDNCFDWDVYFDAVLRYENKSINGFNRSVLKNRVRDKICKIIKCDVYQSNPVAPFNINEFDIVATNFVSESITDSKLLFEKAIKNIISLLKPQGVLVMTLLRNAKYYQVGNKRFKAYPVNEKYLQQVLYENGLVLDKMDVFPAIYSRGFDGIIAVKALKK